MKTTVELKERNRITIPVHIVQGLGLQIGDFLEVTVEVVKRASEKNG
jgi:bifunctional DNA-binding transcriptional regulator/antitoxin component of YhaV-PrlF toxin-antitoxin module